MANASLSRAKNAKNDEFYTQLVDIENELRHYKAHFQGKVVFCNCDDPYESNFFKYFALNFNYLGLKKLICTCYTGSPIVGEQLSLFPEKNPYKIEISEVTDENGDGAIDLADVETLLKNRHNTRSKLKSGDFRDEECVNLLKEADIVVTNPPFSLFREYVAQLIAYDKKFLIIGNKNAITYKEIFPLLKDNKMWLGYESPNEFKDKNGQITKQINGLTRWFTNLDVKKRHETLRLYKTYTPEEFPKYDNYDAINVDKVSDIPYDYTGVMGVPITFLDKYNPEQFEIVAFRKGEDGKDLVFTREREREFNLTFVSLYDVNPGDDQKRRRQNQWEDYLRKNNNQTEKEPIDLFYPLSITSRAAGTMNGLINGKETYRRILIRQKQK